MIAATYFDGHTTRRRPVTLLLHKGIVAMSGDGIRHSFKISQLVISERLEHAPRIVCLPGGGRIEIDDPRFNKMLAKSGYRDPWVVGWQQRWMLALCALVSLLALLLAGYQWGLPWAADRIAQHVPASIEKKIGDEGLRLLDAEYMQPSKLDPVDQARLQRLFSELKQPRGEKTAYRLEFRDSKIGPNALALPNGVIVMTDQLVMLARSDQAVLAVLAHELGHVHRRHSLRRLMQAIGVGVMINLFIGDVSSALAAVPTFLLDQKYSRDFEREADQYAIDMMHANGIPLTPMAELFRKMQVADADEHDVHDHEDDEDAELLDYFSSHPSDDERIARLKAADKAR